MTKWKSNDFLYVKLRTRLDTIGSDTQTDHRMLFFTRLIFWVFSFDLIARYLEKALIIRVL